MKKKFALSGFVVLAATLMYFGQALETVSAQKTQGKTRPAATKYLMRGIVQPNCAGVGKLLKAGPANEKEWDTVACHASCLSEMSFALMDDGRCPDGVWASAAKTTLRECSDALLAAAKKQDLDAANAAFKELTTSCAACHKAHKS